MEKARKCIKVLPARAMPLILDSRSKMQIASDSGVGPAQAGHREKIPRKHGVLPFTADAAVYDPGNHLAMVHLQVSPKQWKSIPDAVKAVQIEYDQLNSITAWDLKDLVEHLPLADCANKTG